MIRRITHCPTCKAVGEVTGEKKEIELILLTSYKNNFITFGMESKPPEYFCPECRQVFDLKTMKGITVIELLLIILAMIIFICTVVPRYQQVQQEIKAARESAEAQLAMMEEEE